MEDNMTTVRVFRDHEEWERHDRWFKMPGDLLADLAICEYEIECECCSIGHLCKPHKDYVYQQHTGAVFIY